MRLRFWSWVWARATTFDDWCGWRHEQARRRQRDVL